MEIGAIIISGIFIVLAIVGIVLFVMYLIARSKGKIVLNLVKMEYATGDTIKGTVKLIIKKPLEASALNISLIGEKKNSNYSVNSSGVSKNNKVQKVFDFKKTIDSSGSYPLGEKSFDFDLTIPKDVTKNTTGNQVLDSVVKSVQAVTGNMGSIRWYVLAELEVKGFNISKKVQINII